MRQCVFILLAASVAPAAIHTVKSAGGGDYTTIQACATAMAAGDTCTVFAGTYAENVTVTAGTTGNYKTLNVNGSDIVTVQSFTLNSHTKLIGNCTVPAAINTCGFNIQNTASPSAAACVAIPNNSTDIYIVNNVMYACGSSRMVGHSSNTFTSTFVYIQGNTLSYACVTQAQAQAGTPKECDGIILGGDHWLLENNDLSHYTLGIYFNGMSKGIFRNNTVHDEYETEAGGNAHTDTFFVEPQVGTTANNVIENNTLYNGVGTNAKVWLTQGQDSGCNSTCINGIIFRFNVAHDFQGPSLSGFSTQNDKLYNNTYVNVGTACTSCGAAEDQFSSQLGASTGGAALNELWYNTASVGINAAFACLAGFDSGSSPTGVWSHNLAYVDANGAPPITGKICGQGSWTDGVGNILGYANHSPTNNPAFTNFAGNDFRLLPSSPALNAGTSLTTVAAGDSGSGTSLVVTDATFFQDGYGLTNANSTVSADCISITTVGNNVCITAVNYATNTLTMASSFTRSVGDPIWLYSDSTARRVLVGTAPNIGATFLGGGGSVSTGVLGGNAVIR